MDTLSRLVEPQSVEDELFLDEAQHLVRALETVLPAHTQTVADFAAELDRFGLAELADAVRSAVPRRTCTTGENQSEFVPSPTRTRVDISLRERHCPDAVVGRSSLEV